MQSSPDAYNRMVDRVYLEFFARKYRSRLESEHYAQFPLGKFDIPLLIEGLAREHSIPPDLRTRALAILEDIKLLYYFHDVSDFYFYLGIAQIVGNSNYDAVNLNSLSLIQQNHYRVYLVSSIYERIFDLLSLAFLNELADPKKDKWGKKYKALSAIPGFTLVTKEEHEMMIDFRDKVRRSEIHGLSSVFRHLNGQRWDHFQKQALAIRAIIERIADRYVKKQ